MRGALYSRIFKHDIRVTRIVMLGIQIMAFLVILGCSAIPPETKLNNRATDVYAHVTRGEWSDVHGYFLPEFQEFCSIEKYTDKNVKGMKVLNHMLGIPEDDFLEFTVLQTNVDGNAGQVYIDISYQGKSLDLGQSKSPREWILVDGEWWSNPEDWEKECP